MNKYSVVLLFAGGAIGLSCRGPQGPVGPPGSGIDDLTNPAVKPRVIYTFPPPNSVGPYEELSFYNPVFLLRFNKIMNTSSLRRAITLSSPSTGIRADTNSLYTFGGDIFSFSPLDSPWTPSFRWKIGETYTLAVASTARDVNGNYLLPSFSMTFVPEPHFRVRATSPPNGAAGVSANAPIYLGFNSPVDSTIFSAIQITPPIPGGRWLFPYYYSDSTWIIFEHQGMSNNATYAVRVDAGARDRYGNQLPQQFILTFSTDAFRVRDTYPANGSTNVYLNPTVYIHLSGPVDTSTVRPAVSISPSAAVNYVLNQGAVYFSFFPTYGFLANTRYTVTISTSLRSMTGSPLAAPYSFSFTTAPFEVVYTIPTNGQSNVSRYTYMHVECNGALDTSSIRSAFRVDPPVAGSFSMSQGAPSFFFYPSSPLAANQTYTVTISTGLRSRGGSYLTAPYSFSFTTGN